MQLAGKVEFQNIPIHKHCHLQVQHGDGDGEELEDLEVMSALATGPRNFMLLAGEADPCLAMQGKFVSADCEEEGCWPCRTEDF